MAMGVSGYVAVRSTVAIYSNVCRILLPRLPLRLRQLRCGGNASLCANGCGRVAGVIVAPRAARCWARLLAPFHSIMFSSGAPVYLRGVRTRW